MIRDITTAANQLVWVCKSCGREDPVNPQNKTIKLGDKQKMMCWKEHKNTQHMVEKA